MSAFMVDKNHIDYLVFVAEGWGTLQGRHQMDGEDFGQLLWDENRKSIDCRYPDCAGNDDDVPGPISETFQYHGRGGGFWHIINPVFVLSAIRCLDYQSCEHDGWRESQACEMLEQMSAEAIQRLCNAADAPWGAPEADAKVRRFGAVNVLQP